eukprot:g11842.t2
MHLVLLNAQCTRGRCRMEGACIEDYVALGGTFDRLHEGHKVLLSCAAAMATRGLVVGISGEPLLREKASASLLQNPFGPSLWPQLRALVVSVETATGAQSINVERRRLGRTDLEIWVVPLVGGQGEGKLSSSGLRADAELLMAFDECWARAQPDLSGAGSGGRWAKLVPTLAKIAGRELLERPERQRQRCLQRLTECLELLSVAVGGQTLELLKVLADELHWSEDRVPRHANMHWVRAEALQILGFGLIPAANMGDISDIK